MNDASPYKKFAELMMHKDSEWIPKILQSMVNEDQAKLLISLPGTANDMAKSINKPIDFVETSLKDMFRKGLVFKSEKGGIVKWRAASTIVQFHDGTILWPDATPAFYELWHNYMEKEWPQLANQLVKFLPKPFTRVIPVGKSIDTGKVKVLAPENVKTIIEKSNRIAVTKCTCRISMQKCDSPIDVCIQINKGADYTIERGSGKEITKESALEIIKQAEDAGLVHVTMNKADVGHFICNCCGCCCQSFSLLISDGLNLCDPSRYIPKIDSQLCTSCGTCEDRCWFNAISLKDNEKAVVNYNKCLGCGQCAIGCPSEAITMEESKEVSFIPS